MTTSKIRKCGGGGGGRGECIPAPLWGKHYINWMSQIWCWNMRHWFSYFTLLCSTHHVGFTPPTILASLHPPYWLQSKTDSCSNKLLRASSTAGEGHHTITAIHSLRPSPHQHSNSPLSPSASSSLPPLWLIQTTLHRSFPFSSPSLPPQITPSLLPPFLSNPPHTPPCLPLPPLQ